MRPFIVLLLFIGAVMLVAGYVRQEAAKAPPRIEYRYIPRNFYDEQLSTQNLKNFYSVMFNDRSAWDTYPFNSQTGTTFANLDVNRS
jgi:hypothetical protein